MAFKCMSAVKWDKNRKRATWSQRRQKKEKQEKKSYDDGGEKIHFYYRSRAHKKILTLFHLDLISLTLSMHINKTLSSGF